MKYNWIIRIGKTKLNSSVKIINKNVRRFLYLLLIRILPTFILVYAIIRIKCYLIGHDSFTMNILELIKWRHSHFSSHNKNCLLFILLIFTRLIYLFITIIITIFIKWFIGIKWFIVVVWVKWIIVFVGIKRFFMFIIAKRSVLMAFCLFRFFIYW
jgi:hypothetical protein